MHKFWAAILYYHVFVGSGTELPSELLENLLRMAPTPEEELKLRLFSGELSQLGNAERFLKSLVDIPFAFKRLESLLFIGTLQEDIAITKESFVNLEVEHFSLYYIYYFKRLIFIDINNSEPNS